MLDPNHVEAIPWYLCRGTHPINILCAFRLISDSVTTPLRLRLRIFVFFLYFFLYFFCIFFLYFFCIFFCIFFVSFFFLCGGILQLNGWYT